MATRYIFCETGDGFLRKLYYVLRLLFCGTSTLSDTYPVANLIRGELLHGSPAEGLPLPLGREEFELFALFIGQ